MHPIDGLGPILAPWFGLAAIVLFASVAWEKWRTGRGD